MSYRVETALSNRAVCKSTECKNHGIKIEKDELRMGVWVEFKEGGSWQWRHWGCVSGKQLDNLRRYLEDPSKPGTYRWDFLDGYSGDEKNALDKHPDLQEKVRRVVTQGFIDPEDFNGDPEMNKLGETGIYTPAHKKQMREDEKNRTHEIAMLQERVTAAETERDALLARGSPVAKAEKKLSVVKGELEAKEAASGDTRVGSKKHVKDEADAEEKPKKKVRKTKAKKEESEDEAVFEAEAEEKPKKKAAVRKSKAKKEESDDENDFEVMPTKKVRGKATVKKEDNADAIVAPEANPPAKGGRGKKVAKKEEDVTVAVKDEDDFDAPADLPEPKKRSTRGKKAVAVKEVADEPVNDVVPAEAKQSAKKGGRGKKAFKEEPVENELVEEAAEIAETKKPAAKKARGKKAPAPAIEPAVNDTKDSTPAFAPEDAATTDPEPAKKPAKGKKIAAATKKTAVSRRHLSRGQTES